MLSVAVYSCGITTVCFCGLVVILGCTWWRPHAPWYLVLECRVGVWPQWYYPGGFN